MDLTATLLLAIAGALWAAFNILASTFKMLNDMRNILLIGKVGNEHVSISFRKHMLRYDWIPAWLLVSFLCFGFGLLVFLAPILVPAEKRTWVLWFFCIVFSLVPFLSSIAWLIGGYMDLKYIRKEITLAEQNSTQKVTE